MKRELLVLASVILLLLSACSSNEPAEGNVVSPDPLVEIPLSAPAFQPGESIPARYTCQGEDLSPELAWGDPPDGTQSFVLIMEDPDAPGKTWDHWIVVNLPAGARGLQEGVARANGDSQLPGGAVHGINSWNREDYGGPCPPSGRHRYFFRLYALDTVLEVKGYDRSTLLEAMEGNILGYGVLMGRYQNN